MKEQNRNVLLVEGSDDKWVIANLLKYHLVGIDKVETVVNIKVNIKNPLKKTSGIDNLLDSIPVEIKNNSELQRFGIIVDADTDIDARWQAVRNRLKKVNADVPEKPNPDGTIFDFIGRDDQEIRIGIWIMPDNKIPGMLEDFLSFLIPEKDMLWNRAKNCVAQIPKEEFAFDIENKDLFSWYKKAELHTWLAWQKEPGKPLGSAISAKYIDPNAPYTHKFLIWLRSLFEFDKSADIGNSL